MLLRSWCDALFGLPTFRRPDTQKGVTFSLSSLLSSFWMLTRAYVFFLGLPASLLFLQRSPLSAGWPLVHLVAHLHEALTHMLWLLLLLFSVLFQAAAGVYNVFLLEFLFQTLIKLSLSSPMSLFLSHLTSGT